MGKGAVKQESEDKLMTVGELKKYLNDFPDTAEVRVWSMGAGGTVEAVVDEEATKAWLPNAIVLAPLDELDKLPPEDDWTTAIRRMPLSPPDQSTLERLLREREAKAYERCLNHICDYRGYEGYSAQIKKWLADLRALDSYAG